MRSAMVIPPPRNRVIIGLIALQKEAAAADKKTSKQAAKPEVGIAKEGVVRSEPYRRLVALMPCKQCQVQEYSQAAHPPPSGKAIKQDDRGCFPLCTTRAGPKGAIEGCHPKFDSYQLYPHDKAVKKAKQWGAETRADVEAAEAWPKKLPRWKDKK